MAGSWEHMTTKSGKLRSNETFCDMVENLGDAYEAAEECYGMVQYLADLLAAHIVVGKGKTHSETRQMLINQASHEYKEGLRIGGVQHER